MHFEQVKIKTSFCAYDIAMALQFTNFNASAEKILEIN